MRINDRLGLPAWSEVADVGDAPWWDARHSKAVCHHHYRSIYLLLVSGEWNLWFHNIRQRPAGRVMRDASCVTHPA